MAKDTIVFIFKKQRIIILFLSLVLVLTLITFLWPFLNKPHLVIRRGMIIIIWILAIPSGIIMISSIFSDKPAMVIDGEGLYLSRLLGGIGRLDWSNIKGIKLRKGKIKIELSDAKSVSNKFVLLDLLFLNIVKNSIYIRKVFLLDISMSELYQRLETNCQRYSPSFKKCSEQCPEKDNLGKVATIVYGYSTLGFDFSPLLTVGANMFKYQDRFYRFDDIDSIELNDGSLVSYPYGPPSAEIILKDGTIIKIVGNLVRRDHLREIDVLSEGTDAFYELLQSLGYKS